MPLDELNAQTVSNDYAIHEAVAADLRNRLAASGHPAAGMNETVKSQNEAEYRRMIQSLDAAKADIDWSTNDPVNNVGIGLVWMTVPTTSIRVSEVMYNDEISGLRTSSSALLKTGRGQVRIEMDLSFPNDWAINNQLRPLIAQFRATPFLPLESYYVRNAILAVGAKVDATEVDKLLHDIRVQYMKLLEISAGAWRAVEDKEFYDILGLLEIDTVAWTTRCKSLSLDELLKEIDKIGTALLGPNASSSKYSTLVLVKGVAGPDIRVVVSRVYHMVDLLRARAEEAERGIASLYTQLAAKGVSESARRPIVPVVLHGMEIRTVPGEQGLTVRLEMLYFFHKTFSRFFLFRDKYGGPTPDLIQCPYFKAYLDKVFLNGQPGSIPDGAAVDPGRYLGRVNSKHGCGFTFTYPTTQLVPLGASEQPRSLSIVVTTEQAAGRPAAYMSAAFDKDRFRTAVEKLVIGPHDSAIVPAEVSIQLRNKIALQPIEGAPYGSAQFLGGCNAKVSVLFTVTGDTQKKHDEGIGALHRMKTETQNVALAYGKRARQNSRIGVDNELLQLAGIRYLQIDGVATSTVPGERMSSTVQMDFTEFTVSQERREMIKHKDDGPKAVYETTLEFAANINEAYLDLKSSSPLVWIAKDGEAGPRIWEMLFRTSYGANGSGTSETGVNGVITLELITDLLAFSLPEVRSAILKNLRSSNTPKRINTKTPSGEMSWQEQDLARTFNQYYELLHGLSSDAEDVKVLEACRGYARKVLDFWSKPAWYVQPSDITTDVTYRASAREVPELVLQTPGGPVTIGPMRNYVEKLVALMRTQKHESERACMDVLSKYIRDNFGTVRDYINAQVNAVTRTSSYPDLDLPRYADLYSVLMDPNTAALQSYDTPRLKQIVERAASVKHLGQDSKDVLTRFMPTWRDLGQRPPIDMSLDDPARTFNDHVDPDFYFFHSRSAPLLDRIKNVVTQANKNTPIPGAPGRVLLSSPTSLREAAAKEADEARFSQMRSSGLDMSTHRNVTEVDRSNPGLLPDPTAPEPETHTYYGGALDVTNPSGEDGEGPEFRYKPGNMAAAEAMGSFIHDGDQHLEGLFREAWDSRKDDYDRMIRAYPAFRLYFVELDQEAFGYWDDFYGYNSVMSISLSKHKFEADLLELKLINVSGNLDEARSKMEDPNSQTDRVDNDPRRGEQPTSSVRPGVSPTGDTLEAGTGEPNTLDKFFLSVGTNLMLYVGYGSEERDLERIFTGSVVEVEPGDITTLLCQSYKNELTVPLNSLRTGADAEVYEVIEWLMDTSPTIHFGIQPIQQFGIGDVDKLGRAYNPDSPELQNVGMSREAAEARKAEETSAKGILARFLSGEHVLNLAADIAPNALGVSAQKLATALRQLRAWLRGRKLWNVYVPRESFMSSTLRWKREFVIPDRTGLEVLHELTRLMPGYVFDVRTYDHHATLFFGKPEQRYFYTAEKQDEERIWSKLSRSFNDKAEADMKIILDLFMKSPEWSNFVRNLNEFIVGTEAKRDLLKTLGRKNYLSELWVKTRITSFSSLCKFGFTALGIAGEENIQSEIARYTSEQLVNQAATEDGIPSLDAISGCLGDISLKSLARFFFDGVSSGDFRDATLIAEIETETARRLADLQVLRISDELYQSTRKKVLDERGLTNRPGSILASLSDWRDKLLAISRAYPDGVDGENLRYNVFNVQRAEYQANWNREGAAKVRTADGSSINRNEYERAVDTILLYMLVWKNFILVFKDWMDSNLANSDLRREMAKSQAALNMIGPNPRTKRFRDYHFADSRLHIIQNSIIATKDQMANTVVVQYPKGGAASSSDDRIYVPADTTWKTKEFVVDMNLDPQDKKVRIVVEHNADRDTKVNVVGNSNLAEAIRPMYRGELILRGNDRIKPFDIVWLNDRYNNISGPIEVERAIFHFDMEHGFTTTVIPHAHVTSGSGSEWKNSLDVGRALCSQAAYYSEQLAGGWIDSNSVKTSVAAMLTTTLFGQELERLTGTGYIGNYFGRGTSAANEVAIDIFPLVRNGLPWTAGLRGMGDGNWVARTLKGWENIKRGLQMARGFDRDNKLGMFERIF